MSYDKTIADIVLDLEKNDEMGETTSSRYVVSSMRDDIDKTEAYINSKHISGDTDYMGREKPFFNIVMAARNVWYRATDIDRKDILIKADKSSDVIKAFLATLKFQEWMRKEDFGQFLNDWGLTLATHGSAISKFIEKDGELSAQVMNWNDFLCDQINFESNVKVQKLWFTPAELKANENYDKELVEELLDSPTTRKTIGGEQKDNKDDYILVYEVHGELPLSLLTDKETDEETYVQQMHVISIQESKDTSDKNFETHTLYSGKEAKDPYMLTHLIKKEGQTYSGGAVKNLFEAQWMVNHSEKMIKDQLDLASKIVFQTSDGSFIGQNVLTNIENGDILKHNQGEPLTMLNNKPDIVAMQSYQASWQSLGLQINGINEAMITAPKSGSAWRQTQAALQEAHSLFELMTENKGLAIERMLREFVLPYFKKTLNNSKEISMILEDHQIKKIDNMYVPNEVIRMMNEKKKNTILNGEIYDPTQELGETMATEQELRSKLTGNQRFIKPSEMEDKTWKELFKDMELTLEVNVTGENRDIQGALATLTTVLQTMVSNPMMMQDPNAKMVFNKILNLAGGVSPAELGAVQEQPMPAMAGVPMPMAQTK